MTHTTFSPAGDGWHSERQAGPGALTLIAVRKSPWCDLGHLEGLSGRIAGESIPEDEADRTMSALKREIEWNSVGWGRCKACHSGAQFSLERAGTPASLT